MRRVPTLLIVVTALAAAVLSGPGLAQAAPVGPAANDWVEVSHPRPGGADTYLNDIVVPAAGDVWSVGYTFDVVGGAFEFRTYGQHCVAGTCTRANLPSREGAPATNFLYGIDAVSPTELWTVGYSRNPFQPGVGLTIHYTNGGWQIVNSPNPAGASSTSLSAVAAISATNAVAVGTYQDSATFEERPLAMRWNGASWQLLTVPQVPGCTTKGGLSDVAKLGSMVVITGTCRQTGGADGGFVLSYKSGAWTVQVAPGDGLLPPTSSLASVAVIPGAGIWVVGSDFSNSVGLAIAFRGGVWRSLPVPQAGAYTQLNGVAGISRTDIWAVGATSQGVGPQRLSLHWTGRSWGAVPAGEATSLAGVAYDPAGFWWSVGHNNSVSVLQRRDA